MNRPIYKMDENVDYVFFGERDGLSRIELYIQNSNQLFVDFIFVNVLSLYFIIISNINCSTIKRYGNTLSGMNYLHVNNMEYCHVESLSNNMIREIRCNIEEKWMKVSERSYDNEFCNKIEINGLQIHDIIDTSFSGERWEGNSLNGLPFGYG